MNFSPLKKLFLKEIELLKSTIDQLSKNAVTISNTIQDNSPNNISLEIKDDTPEMKDTESNIKESYDSVNLIEEGRRRRRRRRRRNNL